MACPLRGGGGGEDKKTLFKALFSYFKNLKNILLPLSSRGGGKALVAMQLFCGFPNKEKDGPTEK